MNTNENIRTNPQEDIIELGAVSVETKGGGEPLNEPQGRMGGTGISE